MTMLRWEPFGDAGQLRDHVNRLIEQSLQGVARGGREPASARVWAPVIDILESADALIVQAELAGIDPESVDIQLAGDVLTLRGERTATRSEDKKYLRSERAYGPFERSFTLGIPVNEQAITAKYKAGLLEITIPKAEAVKPKQIKVEDQGG